MQIRPVGIKLFHADGRTDRHDETNSRFLQIFANGSKNHFIMGKGRFVSVHTMR
jgi:hypothetical protein